MRATAWRPSTALRKRRSAYLSFLDASGVAALFVFFLAIYLVRSSVVHGTRWPGSNLASHPKPMPGALKEDAITVVVTRDGTIFLGGTRPGREELPGLIRNAYEHGAERKVYLRPDARAKYGDIKAALDLIREAGIQDVAFVVEQTRQPND